MSTWPATLPAPQALPTQAAERRRLSEVRGPLSARNVQRDYAATQQLQFTFTATEAAIYKAWRDIDLQLGGAWFNATWPLPRGTAAAVRRLLPGTERRTYLGGGIWRVQVACAVRGRGLPVVGASATWDEGYVDGPGVVSGDGLTFSETHDTAQTWTRANVSVSSGKWYWELAVSRPTGGVIANADQFLGVRGSAEPSATGLTAGATCVMRTQGATGGASLALYVGSTGASMHGLFANGILNLGASDRVGIAFDATTGKLWFRSLGYGFGSAKWLTGVADPAAGADAHITGVPAGAWHPFCGIDNDDGDNVCTLHTAESAWLMAGPVGFATLPSE